MKLSMWIRNGPHGPWFLTWVHAAAPRSPNDAEWSESKQQRDGQQDHQCSQFDLQGRDVGRVDPQGRTFPPRRQEDRRGNSASDRHLYHGLSAPPPSLLCQTAGEEISDARHGFTQEARVCQTGRKHSPDKTTHAETPRTDLIPNPCTVTGILILTDRYMSTTVPWKCTQTVIEDE